MSSPRTSVGPRVVTPGLFPLRALFGSVVTGYPDDPDRISFETGNSSVAIAGTMPRSANGPPEFADGTTGYSNFIRDLSSRLAIDAITGKKAAHRVGPKGATSNGSQ